MQVTSYFSNIRDHIIDLLDSAESSIKIAMAWFTNPTLFEIVLNKAASGVEVILIISDSEANFRYGCSLDFARLCKKGMQVYVVPSLNGVFMHHKYAVIDKRTVITGSYNWTNNAQTNLENIIIIHDTEQAKKYSIQHDHLKEKSSVNLVDFVSRPVRASVNDELDQDAVLYKLTKAFETEADNAMKEAKALVPSLSLNIIDTMIKKYTAVGAATKLSNDGNQSGFIKLIEINRPDLTFEYMVLKAKYQKLFDKPTILNAKKKLYPSMREKVENIQ